jgi:hypothetical protein
VATVHRLLHLFPVGAQLIEHAGHRGGLGVEDIEHSPHPGVDFADGARGRAESAFVALNRTSASTMCR